MILLTGGSGRLGTELRKHVDCLAPPRAEFDILNPAWPKGVSTVVHCAAYTDVKGAETDRDRAYVTNVGGTLNMTAYPLVYISTEYVFDGRDGMYAEDDEPNPVNYYARTKYLGERMARSAPRSLVIRCVFKERPYRHPVAPVDQYTSGDYVDRIAPKVAQCIKWFEAGHFQKHDTIHVGTGRKSTMELAEETRDVRPVTLAELTTPLPRDTSLDCSKYYAMAEEYAHGY